MTQTEVYKKLLREKIPPKTEEENIFASIILALSERVDKAEKQNAETVKAVKLLAKLLKEMPEEDPASSSETVETAASNTTAPVTEETGPRDKTPFPEGVKTQASGPAGATLDETLAAQPDATSGPARNPAPIPAAPVAPSGKTKNGNGSGAKAGA